jgi:hypothetical protein
MDIDVVALKGLYERLGHAIGLRAANRCEARNQAQPLRKLDRLVGSVAAAVVREPLDRVRCDPPYLTSLCIIAPNKVSMKPRAAH